MADQNAGIKKNASILDLGCGPGLYTSRLARAGFQITGMDYSYSSIEYATKYANDNNLKHRLSLSKLS
ncbi:MAG: class I SAM-dependent methyltransferase [Anaerolineales bacterium]|nr:class I SAM-dependent methyltransferase [Anaerolineales bacterium]